jgi:hypothetical protein
MIQQKPRILQHVRSETQKKKKKDYVTLVLRMVSFFLSILRLHMIHMQAYPRGIVMLRSKVREMHLQR